MNVVKRDGSVEPFDISKIEKLTEYATSGLKVNTDELKKATKLLIYDGMKTEDIFKAQVSAASGLISVEHPDYTYVAARYLLSDLYKRVAGAPEYGHLADVIDKGVTGGRYTKALYGFDLERLNTAIKPERDFQFDYYGLTNIIDRYLMRLTDQTIIELPQHFFMRVAMGLALAEGGDPTDRAIEFYELLSQFDGMSSTPTLFNSGTVRSQLSSCYLNIVADQISADEGQHQHASIFGTIEECAKLSKYAGGIGTSWTKVRGEGSLIKGTNGRSAGAIPYIKVYNDTAVAVNQGGKRKGSFAPYLEPWHPDFFAFCELKKEFGDEGQRAKDVYPAAWIPDLFMKRVKEKGDWSEFQPHLYPELHELWGSPFEQRYVELEQQGKAFRVRKAEDVWRHILTHLFETGHPWITFKDESNRRNPQDHAGVIHSSNLCTEITLNTSDDETAVCNLGSVNLAKHVTRDGTIDFEKLEKTVTTMVRMLDNVIDLNYYPSSRAKAANLKHRAIGLGVMGYTEALVACDIDWESSEHLDWADELFERFSYFAINASADLAIERGAYESFKGSQWSRGVLPIDTARDTDASLDWDPLRQKIKDYGLRNSNVMAIAPTATISIITGTTPCIEPIFELVSVESNISGTFQVPDPSLKYGRPELCKTVWEIDPVWVIEAAAVRQKWIDQAQSTTLFIKAGTKGKELADLYFRAWDAGLKTTYYLRTQSNTVQDSVVKTVTLVDGYSYKDVPLTEAQLCSLENGPECEACQ